MHKCDLEEFKMVLESETSSDASAQPQPQPQLEESDLRGHFGFAWSGLTELHLASLLGDDEAVRQFLRDDEFTEVDLGDVFGRTALHCAATCGHVGVVDVLLGSMRFMAVNAVSESIVFDPIEINTMIENERELCNSRGYRFVHFGGTALHAAAKEGHVKVVERLLGSERFTVADAVMLDGATALHLAASEGREDVVQALLDNARFVSVDAQDIFGRTALHNASENGHVSVVNALVILHSQIPLDTLLINSATGDRRKLLGVPFDGAFFVILDPKLANPPPPGHPFRDQYHCIAYRRHCRVVLHEDCHFTPAIVAFTRCKLCFTNGATALHLALSANNEQVVMALLGSDRFTATAMADVNNNTALDISSHTNTHIFKALLRSWQFVENRFEIQVCTLSGQTYDVVVCGSQSVDLLRKEIADLMEVEGIRIALFCNFRALENGTPLSDYGLSSGSCLSVVIEADDESGLETEDIALVQSQSLCSREAAVIALKRNNGDIVEAMMELSRWSN